MSKIICGNACDPLALEVTTTSAHFDSLREEWNALFQCAGGPSSALTWEWARVWWEVYQTSLPVGSHLQILTVRRNRTLVALLPLYITPPRWPRTRPTLRFISTGEPDGESTYPQNLDVLVLPEEREPATGVISGWIRNALASLDAFDLGVTGRASTLYQVVETIARDGPGGKRPAPHLASKFSSIAFHAEITGGLEDYLSRLAPTVQKRLTRVYRALLRGDASFTIAQGSDEQDRFFTELCRLHEKRWRERGETGALAASRVVQFHRELLVKMASNPFASPYLGRLSSGGEAAAIVYGFRCGSRFEFYQSGIDLDLPLRSPGLLAHLAMIEHLSGAGVTTYDLLEGDSRYKRELSTDSREVLWPILRSYSHPTAQRALQGGFSRIRRALAQIKALRV